MRARTLQATLPRFSTEILTSKLPLWADGDGNSLNDTWRWQTDRAGTALLGAGDTAGQAVPEPPGLTRNPSMMGEDVWGCGADEA